MNGLAQATALISAVVYIAAAPLELFFISSPRVRALPHVEADNVADVRMWAFCIGFRNLLAAIGTIVGPVILWTGDEVTGRAIVITALCYMLLASLAMGIADLLGLWRPPRRKRARHPRIQPAAAGRPHRSRLLTQQTDFLRSATRLRCRVIRLQTATVMAHRDRE